MKFKGYRDIRLIVLLAGCILLIAGCRDEVLHKPTNNGFRFDIAVLDNSWHQTSPSADSLAKQSRSIPLCKLPSSDSLFLHLSASEGIKVPESGARATRGTGPVSSATIADHPSYQKFAINGYRFYGSSYDPISEMPDPFIYEESIERSAQNGYIFSGNRHFLIPSDGSKFKFFSYAPINPKYIKFREAPDGVGGVKVGKTQIRYGLPDADLSTATAIDAREMSDLIVAESGIADATANSVTLNYRHAMAALQVIASDGMVPCQVKSIEFVGICSYGIYDIQSKAWVDSETGWAIPIVMDQIASVAAPLPDNPYEIPDSPIYSGENTFFIIPQTLPDWAEARIKIRVDGETEDRELTASLGGVSFSAGMMYTLQISTDSWWYGLEMTSESRVPGQKISLGMENFDFSMADQSKEVTVVSSRTYGTHTYPSDIQIYTYEPPAVANGYPNLDFPAVMDDWFWSDVSWGDMPSWLNIETTHSTTDPSVHTVKFTAKGFTAADCRRYDIDNIMQTNGETAGVTELSAHNNLFGSTSSENGILNTANCYVLDRGGYYTLPLVYGNAIKHGKDNKEAYTYTNQASASSDVLSRFINHLGLEITSPYLADNLGSSGRNFTTGLARAELLWQDRQSLIDEVALDMSLYGGKGGIKFHVPSATIGQGNAVIAVRDSQGEVAWSWHIWVGAPNLHNYLIPVTNHIGRTYYMMSMNLGWVSTQPIEQYPTRVCWVKIKNSNTGDASVIFRVVQEGKVGYTSEDPSKAGFCTYYQWGRKDPFMGASLPSSYPGKSCQNRACYDINNQLILAPNSSAPNELNASQFGSRAEALKQRVLNPITWHESRYSDGEELYLNLWDGGNDNASVSTYTGVKTIYDPCPQFFQVPPADAFTGFTKNGLANGYDDYSADIKYRADKSDPVAFKAAEGYRFETWNAKWDSDSRGFLMYCAAKTIGSPFTFFPTTGYRSWKNKGQAYGLGTDGFYWTASPASDANHQPLKSAYKLCFLGRNYKSETTYTGELRDGKLRIDPFHINPFDAYYNSDGMALRPVREVDALPNGAVTTPASAPAIRRSVPVKSARRTIKPQLIKQ